MASRHHYSIPGASLLKTRGSSKAQTQKTAAGSGNVPSSSRDTRQPSSSRAYYTQDTAPRNAPPSRPPSASGYRTQQPNASVNGFQASSNTRPPPAQRPAMTPQASSSRTRLDVPDPRSYFSKMFSRKQTPVGAQGEEKHKSSHKHQRSSQAYPAAYAPTAAAQAPAPPAGPSAGWTAYDADASLRARELEREDRARQKTKEDPVRAERMKVERMHSEYAVYKAKLEETEQAQAAAAAKATRMDRTASRPSREERRQQEYESDNARRRLQAQQVASSSARKQEARQSHYLHPAQLPTTIPSRATAPARDALQTPAPQTATRPPGVPVQPSTSSQSTSASHQAQALHSAPPLTRTEPIITSAPTPAPALIPASAPAPPPKVSSTPYQSSNYTLSQNPPRQTEALPSAPNMLPPYQPSGPDERNRLDREAAEREALLSRERECERERERESERCREAREAAEREALASREREHERELERRRESDKEAAEREVLQHRERERERELERERRRARRAERERKKELENAERERRKELENAERERQKEFERAERERLRALEQFELEKQREAERLQRERKEYERAEKERLKAERERQRDAERIERERLREKAERERERAIRTSSKHRSHRDKTQSMPTNPPPGAASGSDTDRTGRKDGRHRSQSHPPVVASETQPLVSPFGIRRPESRKDTVPAPVPGTVQSSAPKPDNIFSHHDPAQLVPESPMALPIPPPHVERRDQVIYPRRMSTVPSSTQTQGLMPPKMPERSHTDTLLSRDPPVGGMQASAATMQLPEPLPVALQSKLVSIYASQGPPDRTPYRATQKAPSLSTAEQRAPGPTPTLPTATNEYEGRPRSSLDHSSYRPSTIPANTATPVIPAATSTSAPQVQPQLEPSTATQAPSATSLRHFMMSTQPPSNDMNTATSITPMLKPPSRPDTGFVPPHGKALPSPDIHVPLSSAQSAHQTNSTATQQPVDDRLASVKPAVVTSHGAGFSSYSQSVLGSTKEPSRASAQDQQLGTMSRAPSNNSTRSPSRKAALLPTETASGAFSTIPVSRTASDASQSTETGEHRQLSASYSQSQPHVTSLQHLQPTSATPMYSSAQNASLTSRVPHESVTNLHQQSVFPTHSHSQSLPQQTSSSNPYNSSDVENGFSRYDNLSNGRTAAPLSATNTIPDGSHQQYPSIQQSSSQSKANYNSSSNAYLPVQSQQSHPMLSSSTQDNNSHLWTPMLTNNMSPYSAVVASPNPLSQTPSTMFSQPPVHPSNSSMYHNPSTSRIHVPTYQAHQQQQAAGITKPPLPQQNSSQLPTAAVKSSGPPTGPTNPSVYVTSTRQSGPFVDDTPSSIGIGLSLDSPPASRPPLQQPLQPTDRSTPQPAYIRSQAASGLSSTPMHSASQAQVHTQTQKAETPQDMDSPPPLTPSSSSRESHEEILMTPASLDPARAQVNVQQPPDSSQRSEKKKGGLFGLFRSSSTRSTKEKEVRDRAEPRGYESRRQVPGPSHDQRSESVNRLRSTRPPSIVITAESDSNPTNTGSVSMNHQVKQSRASRRAPPPIAIPQQSIPYRLFASKSKRYRTMSSASMEALDGTANNTVVGSPTSSRRSPTPSGPMTPPVRDPIEAAQVWRSNEDVFLDRGSHRRRRPGVTFDLKGDDVQKDGALYRHQSSRLHRQRKDPPR